MKKEFSQFIVSNADLKLLDYDQVIVGFRKDGSTFNNPWTPQIDYVTSCRSPANHRTDLALFFTLERLFYKCSIGSTTLSPSSFQRLRQAVVTSGLVKYKKPKRPVYHPLKFFGREPVLRLVDESKILMPKQGNVPDHKWASKKLIYEHRRLNLISVINDRRQRIYDKKRKAYDERYANFLKRQQEHLYIHGLRSLKYMKRHAVWEKAVDAAARRALRLLPRNSGIYTEQHPYVEIALASDDDQRNTLMYHWNTLPIDSENVNIANAVASTATSLNAIADPEFQKEFLRTLSSQIYSAISPSLEEFEGPLVRKLYDVVANQKAHIGNLIAERKQTMEMLATTWLRVYDLVKAKRSIFEVAGNYITSPKKIANDILAFKFGVEPLIKDISEALDHLSSDDPMPLTVTSRAMKQIPIKFDSESLSFNGLAEIRYTATWNVGNDIDRLLSQYGLVDPTQIAWEVTPWSFVVDWFIPIGAWIQAQTAQRGMDLNHATKSVKLIGDFNFKPCNIVNSPYGPPYDFMSLVGPLRGYTKHRVLLDTLPDSNRVLYFKSPWSWSHAIEAVALAVQRLK